MTVGSVEPLRKLYARWGDQVHILEVMIRQAHPGPEAPSYRLFAENKSMLNTPNTWGIYIISLVCVWLRDQGGLASIKHRNEEKAAILYDAIDASDGYYSGHADRNARSTMNVTFRLPSEELEDQFCSETAGLGLDGLKGHRSVGGVRASIYNAFPREGVEKLVGFMQDFARRNG